jgi:hypothetical protein
MDDRDSHGKRILILLNHHFLPRKILITGHKTAQSKPGRLLDSGYFWLYGVADAHPGLFYSNRYLKRFVSGNYIMFYSIFNKELNTQWGNPTLQILDMLRHLQVGAHSAFEEETRNVSPFPFLPVIGSVLHFGASVHP